MNALTALLPTLRIRHLSPALLSACALGCNAILDIDGLDRGSSSGSGGSGGSGGNGGSEVEIIATEQCNPGRLLVTSEHVYWTTNYEADKVTDEVCVSSTKSTAIRRLPLGSKGAPEDVVTENLDGAGTGKRLWELTLLGKDLYWSTEASKVCRAEAGGMDQACEVPVSNTCKSYGIASAGGLVYFHAGPCTGNSAIQSYDPVTGDTASPGFGVAGNFVAWMAISAGASPWIAWLDACAEDVSVRRINVARLHAPSMSWSLCFATKSVSAAAVDEDGLYWISPDDSAVYELPLPAAGAPIAQPRMLVSGLKTANALALDAKHVYITSDNDVASNTDRGSVFYLAKGKSGTTPMAELGVVASDRKSAHGGVGLPFAISAGDPHWLYWLLSGRGYAVERARKPD